MHPKGGIDEEGNRMPKASSWVNSHCKFASTEDDMAKAFGDFDAKGKIVAQRKAQMGHYKRLYLQAQEAYERAEAEFQEAKDVLESLKETAWGGPQGATPIPPEVPVGEQPHA